jgi:hypothetical protein
MMIAQTVLGKFGQPDDIGSVVVFICSDEANGLQGKELKFREECFYIRLLRSRFVLGFIFSINV